MTFGPLVPKRKLMAMEGGSEITKTFINTLTNQFHEWVENYTFQYLQGTLTKTYVLPVVGTLMVESYACPVELQIDMAVICYEVYISVPSTGSPTGAAIIVDVNLNGTTIFTTEANRPQIAAGGTGGTSGTPNVTAFNKNDKLSVDVDQIGSGDAGADLTVSIRCTANISVPFTS